MLRIRQRLSVFRLTMPELVKISSGNRILYYNKADHYIFSKSVSFYRPFDGGEKKILVRGYVGLERDRQG